MAAITLVNSTWHRLAVLGMGLPLGVVAPLQILFLNLIQPRRRLRTAGPIYAKQNSMENENTE
jgi:hypothetical protein